MAKYGELSQGLIEIHAFKIRNYEGTLAVSYEYCGQIKLRRLDYQIGVF